MSRLKFCNDLKTMLVYDQRTKDFTVGQLRIVFDIIDELYEKSSRDNRQTEAIQKILGDDELM